MFRSSGGARIDLSLDPVLHRLDQSGQRQVRVDGGVDRAVFESARRRDAQRGGAVLEAPVGKHRRPEPGVPQTAVGVDGRCGHRCQRGQVLEHPADRVQADLAGQALVFALRHESVLIALPQRDVVVAAVGRHAHERLGHEAREHVQLAPDLLADLAEGGEVVGGLLGAVEVEVQLDLARRVLVVALDHVEAHRLAVLDHLVDDRLELLRTGRCGSSRAWLRPGRRACRRPSSSATSSPARCRRAGAGRCAPRTSAWIRLRLLRQSEVRKAPGVLLVFTAAEAGAPHARHLLVPGQHLEGVRLGDADQLPGLRAVADVLAVAVGEEVGGGAVHELEALLAIDSQCGAGTPLPMIRPVTEMNW